MNRYERENIFREEQKAELQKFKAVAERILLGQIKPSAEKIKELDDFIKIVDSVLHNRSNLQDPEKTYIKLIIKAIHLELNKL